MRYLNVIMMLLLTVSCMQAQPCYWPEEVFIPDNHLLIYQSGEDVAVFNSTVVSYEYRSDTLYVRGVDSKGRDVELVHAPPRPVPRPKRDEAFLASLSDTLQVWNLLPGRPRYESWWALSDSLEAWARAAWRSYHDAINSGEDAYSAAVATMNAFKSVAGPYIASVSVEPFGDHWCITFRKEGEVSRVTIDFEDRPFRRPDWRPAPYTEERACEWVKGLANMPGSVKERRRVQTVRHGNLSLLGRTEVSAKWSLFESGTLEDSIRQRYLGK